MSSKELKRVLIIDDEPQVRRMLKKFFLLSGYDSSDAQDGKVGIQIQREIPFDIVITDIFMPEVDGIEMIKMLKTEFPDTKIIAMSGGYRGSPNHYFDYLEAAEVIGADCSFVKPIDLDKLLDKVGELLVAV